MTYNKKNGRLSDMFTLFVDTVLVLFIKFRYICITIN